ncbi:MAG: DUF1232 domain-containing protein [Anaerovoracaceae bacterium]|nr:DUF1232 domain-containing protein [Clostridiales bacterium]
MQFITFNVIIKRIIAIKAMMKDKSVSKWKKLLVIFGLVYLFVPIDLIPGTVFPLGMLDDLILWIGILYFLRETLDNYWLGEKTVDLSREYKDKTVINDVEYEVEEEYTKED